MHVLHHIRSVLFTIFCVHRLSAFRYHVVVLVKSDLSYFIYGRPEIVPVLLFIQVIKQGLEGQRDIASF